VKNDLNDLDDAKRTKGMYRQRTQKAWEHTAHRAAGPASSSTAPGVNDTELVQRGGGVFTEGRWCKQLTAEILALNTHIKRHPSVGSYGEAPRSIEQEDPHYAGHVCFIDRLPGLSAIPDRPDIATMQEKSQGLMIAPLSDGNAATRTA